MKRFELCAARICVAIIVLTVTSPVLAEWKPSMPVKFIVMAGKGGGADKAVRFIAKAAAKHKLLSVPFEIENISGNSGGDAMVALKRRAGDNHTLMFTLNSFYTTPVRQPKLGIDISTFTPIGRMAEDAFVLWVNTKRKDINSMAQFIEAVRQRGKKWVMAGTGTGSEDNLLTDFLNATYGLQMTYRPLKGGGAVAKQLVNNQADSTVNNPSEQHAYFLDGKTKPIVAFTPKRLKAYLKAPALRETSMSFFYFMQRSVVGPAGMSEQAVRFYEAMFRKLFNTAEWQGYRTKNSLRGPFLTGDALRKYWSTEREKHRRWLMAIDLMALAGQDAGGSFSGKFE